MNLPGICQSCRLPVVWNGKRWRNPGQRNGGHVCLVSCGKFMPLAGDKCGRKPGHQGYHRSRYAMANECRAKGSLRSLASVQS